MSIELKTTGASGSVVIDDLNARTFTHPVTFDLLTEFRRSEIDASLRSGGSLEAAIAAGDITVNAVPQLRTRYVSASGTIEAYDNEVTIVDTSLGNVTVQLFPSNEHPNDGLIHRYWVYHLGGGNLCQVVCADGSFADGLTKLFLDEGDTAQLGGMYDAALPMWLRISKSSVDIQVRRNASWAAANFAAPTAVPFDVSDFIDNNAVLDWSAGTPTQIIVRKSCRLEARYAADFDSTGGVTWNVQGYLRLNGVTTVPGSVRRGGNFGNEDDSISDPCQPLDLTVGDYLELILDQSNLTGNLVGARLTISTEV